MSRYTLYIDESGEPGIINIRSAKNAGASRYMTLGGVIVRNQDKQKLRDSLTEIKTTFKKEDLQCKHLDHYQKIYFARNITKHNMRFFGVISDKNTLLEYKHRIENDHSQYYNKCAMYLLEKVGWFMETRKLNPCDLDIVFEKTNIDYTKMRNLIAVCKQNPIRPATKKLKNIDENRIKYAVKEDEPLLQIADLAAHALYKCVDNQPKNYDLTEPRYLKELSSRFFGNPKDNLVLNAGIYCVKSGRKTALKTEIDSFLRIMSSIPPD